MCDDCKEDPWYADIKAFLEKFPDAEWGPAHVVFSDFNTDNPCVEYCLREANNIKAFLANRIQVITEPLEDSQQLYTLHFQLVDMMAELNSTIAFLENMLQENRHRD